MIGFGVIALLNGLNMVELSFWQLIGTYWPVLLIVWGLGFALEPAGYGGKILGFIVAALGLGFLGGNLEWWDGRLIASLIWPALLIWLGIRIILGSNGKFRLGMMGEVKCKDGKLENGSYMACMGGVELDLRQMEVTESRTIQVTALMGGVEIVVPTDMVVVCEGTAILGGVEFFKKGNGGIVGSLRAVQGDAENASKVVRVDCLAIMGGVEVKAKERME